MTLHTETTEEKLQVVERLIAAEIRHGNPSTARVLKGIAADLRGRLAKAPSAVLVDVERRVNAVKQSKTAVGYANGAVIRLGEGVAVNWPTIKQALELFGAALEETA